MSMGPGYGISEAHFKPSMPVTPETLCREQTWAGRVVGISNFTEDFIYDERM
jgi:hypothetical protein